MSQIKSAIQDLYELRDRQSVLQFLSGHPQLGQDLIHVHGYIAQYFGPEPRVTLRIVTDPEIPNWTQLFAHIHTTQPFDSALDTLDSMCLHWFRDRPVRDRNALTLTVDVNDLSLE